jgi:predicted dehydrogenase
MNRRVFLATALSSSRIFGANDRLRLGFIGLGGRAQWLLKNEKFPGAEIVAMADCFLPQCDKAASLQPEYAQVTKYQDYRKLLEKEKLDAVFIETTTHARALIALQAMQLGLDVYAEKPLTLTVEEGQLLVKAVERYKRVLQTGTQQRSIPINAWASKFVREGGLGKVREVIACNFEPPKTWTARPGQPAPAGLDWDLWCNQTELRPFHEELRGRWAWYWDYDGGGQSWGVSGWGTHALDQVQCALGTDTTGPVEIWLEGEGERPAVMMKYASGTVLKMNGKPRPDHSDLGAIFVGEKGTLEIKRGTLVAEPGLLKDAPPDTLEGPGENSFHIANFLDCIRTRKRPNAWVEAGHRSTSVCHLTNMCRELGRKLRWDPAAEQFIDDAEASRKLARPRRKGYELPKIV